MMSLFSSFDMYFWNFLFPICIFSILGLTLSMKFLSTMNFIYMSSVLSMSFYFSTIKSNKIKMMDIFLIFCMMGILMINLMSIFPYYFSLTSQFMLYFSFSFSAVLSIFFFMMKNNFKGLLYHFIPEGSPVFLSFFLFVIEVVSSMIRPLTLVIRLMSNILAGHLLLILLSKMVFIYLMFFQGYIFLIMVEMFVALIQSYIFGVLLSLYFSEII